MRTHHNLGEKSGESEEETILLSGHPYQDQLPLQMWLSTSFSDLPSSLLAIAKYVEEKKKKI